MNIYSALKTFLSISIVLTIVPTTVSKTCDIWSSDTQQYFPLPLFEWEDGLMYVNGYLRFIEIEDGKSFNMSCIGSYLQYYNVGYKDLDSVTVDCRNGTLFSDEWIPGKPLSLKWVSCLLTPRVIQKHTAKTCGEQDKGKLIEIYMRSRFQKNHYLYEVCFDDSIKQPLFVKYKLEKNKLQYFDNMEIKYVYGDSQIFSDVGLQEFYEYGHYKNILLAKLGQYAWQYLLNINWIINGTLIEAKTFSLDPAQRATYDYINYVPMWDQIARGSWIDSAGGFQTIVKDMNITIYSGSWGVLSLKDGNNKYHEIRLESVESMRYPLPQWLYRVGYDEVSKKGVALLILNNPSATVEEAKELAKVFPCSDACPNWTWITNATPQKGYVVCCDINDFRKVIKDLPDFETVGLLP